MKKFKPTIIQNIPMDFDDIYRTMVPIQVVVIDNTPYIALYETALGTTPGCTNVQVRLVPIQEEGE